MIFTPDPNSPRTRRLPRRSTYRGFRSRCRIPCSANPPVIVAFDEELQAIARRIVELAAEDVFVAIIKGFGGEKRQREVQLGAGMLQQRAES